MAKKNKQTNNEDIIEMHVPRRYPWRTTWNNKFRPTLGEVNFQPSETRPDEVMTMREIEQRYANGKSIMDVLPRPVWDTEEELTFDDYLPDIRTLDHADRMDLLEETKAELDEIKKRANKIAADRKAQRDAQRAEEEKLQAEKIAAILAAKTGSGGTPDPQ